MDIKSIFRLKPDKVLSDANVINATTSVNNPDAQFVGETYGHWGLRICAKTSGSLFVLTPFLQRVYSTLKKEQSDNITLQQQLQNDNKTKIVQMESEIEKDQKDMTFLDDKIRLLDDKKEELRTEKFDIENHAAEVNKDEKVKLILGLFILIPLTIYLFTFYGSTFYSAFFKDFSNGSSLTECMFDPNAYASAFSNGVMELIFVLCAPIIFLGLGFALHFFSVDKKSKVRFLKMGAVILVTFIFDVILAYSIGKNLYNVWCMTTLENHPEYSASLALKDINLWAVIFCGFIVYIIWGIVFDMTITAYNNMYINHTRMKQINEEINKVEEKIESEKTEKNKISKEIISKQNEKKKLLNTLTDSVRYDYLKISTEMTNFYSGWIQQMVVFQLNSKTMQQAQSIFNQTTKSLIPE